MARMNTECGQSKLFPTVIEYQPYAICNANCTYCPVGMLNKEQRQKGESMRVEVFERIIGETKGRSIERVSPHLNCEPLLCKDLPDQLLKWRTQHPEAQIAFSTNGVFLTDDTYSKLVDSGVDELQLHFMGISKEYHESAMHTNYERVRRNIESVAKRNQTNNDSIKLTIFCHRLVGASLSDWQEFAREWKDKGVGVVLGPLWNRAGYYGAQFDDMSVGMRNNEPGACNKPFKQIAIEHDGRVILCSLDVRHKIQIGNIMEQTIEDIWNGPAMTLYREGQSAQHIRNLELCKDCIRGGNYLLDESALTRIINFDVPENPADERVGSYLLAMERF